MTVSIVDYGVGNIGSIKNMLKRVGAESEVVRTAESISSASRLILPGVGAFDNGIEQLERAGLRPALDEAVLERGVPVAGICLGMQLMTRGSDEGKLSGLGWVNAATRKIDIRKDASIKLPHMGWTHVNVHKSHPVVENLDAESRFYFVHTFAVNCENDEDVLLTANYRGIEFVAAFQRGNIFGFQFHPEKSHRHGMGLLKSFVENS